MPQYRVVHDYRSSKAAFDAGAVVDLEEVEAAWFNVDSPGVLVDAAVPTSAPAADDSEPEPEEGSDVDFGRPRGRRKP